MIINILNEPENINEYKYIVLARAFGMENTYLFYGGTDTQSLAEQKAAEIGGFVIYNVEFQLDTPESTQKTFTISGDWYLTIKAKDNIDARQKFLAGDYDDEIEICLDKIEVWED